VATRSPRSAAAPPAAAPLSSPPRRPPALPRRRRLGGVEARAARQPLAGGLGRGGGAGDGRLHYRGHGGGRAEAARWVGVALGAAAAAAKWAGGMVVVVVWTFVELDAQYDDHHRAPITHHFAGDVVAEDDVIAQIETDKVTIDVKYTAPAPGTVGQVLVKDGDTVVVGQAVATVEQVRRRWLVEECAGECSGVLEGGLKMVRQVYQGCCNRTRLDHTPPKHQHHQHQHHSQPPVPPHPLPQQRRPRPKPPPPPRRRRPRQQPRRRHPHPRLLRRRLPFRRLTHPGRSPCGLRGALRFPPSCLSLQLRFCF